MGRDRDLLDLILREQELGGELIATGGITIPCLERCRSSGMLTR